MRFPNILDRYIFKKYFTILLLVFFCLLSIVIFVTLLENLNTINRNDRQLFSFLSFIWFKIPEYMNQIIPLSALTAVLLSLGLLNKSTEITAMKTVGVSLYRIVLSLCIPALVLSFGSFHLQEYIIPRSNAKAEKVWKDLKSSWSPEINGVPVRIWRTNSTGSHIYSFVSSESDSGVFGQLHLFKIDPVKWSLESRMYAETGYFEDQRLYLAETWRREFSGEQSFSFEKRDHSVLEIEDKEELFQEPYEDPTHMNYRSLMSAIRDYKQRGFDTQRLRVDLNYKLSFPFLSLILTLLGIPFAFLMGKRGVLWGIGLSLAIAIIYWGCTGIFKNLGYTNNLNAYWAGWGPHLLFGFVGLYLIAKMRT